MSPQQTTREKGKSFPWAADWLQRHSEKATATWGLQRQSEGSTRWRQIQAARLCPSPTPPMHSDKSLGSTAAAGASSPCPTFLGADSFWFGCLRYLPGVARLVIAACLWEGLIRFSMHWHQVLLDTPWGIHIRLSDTMPHLRETCVFLKWQLRLGRNVLGHLKWH